MKTEVSFEKALAELETIVKKLESGEISLDESIELYEKGIKLTEICTGILDKAKQKIEVIKNENYKNNEFDNTATGDENNGI